jgi:hypothetical protein
MRHAEICRTLDVRMPCFDSYIFVRVYTIIIVAGNKWLHFKKELRISVETCGQVVRLTTTGRVTAPRLLIRPGGRSLHVPGNLIPRLLTDPFLAPVP